MTEKGGGKIDGEEEETILTNSRKKRQRRPSRNQHPK